VDGVSYPGPPFGCCGSLLGTTDLVFTTPAISVPPQDPGRLIIFGAPFGMTGSLQLTPRGGAAVLQSSIAGSGTLDLQARVETPGGALIFESGTFRFTSLQPSPTPEPATLFMMGAGLIVAGRRLRRR